MRFLSTRNLFHSSFSLCILAHEVKVEVLVAQSCPTLCDPLDCSPPGPSVHKICQARTLEWRAIPFLRGTSWSRDQIQVSHITGRFFTIWATREASTLAHQFSSVQSLSHVQLFATPMNRSTPGLPVHHQLSEFTQTHVHRVSDAISSSDIPFSSCSQSLPASASFPMSHLFGWGAKVLEFQL